MELLKVTGTDGLVAVAALSARPADAVVLRFPERRGVKVTLKMTGPGGHAEVVFEKDEIRMSFVKTSEQERGAMMTLIEKGKKEGMKVHTVDKKGALKEVADEAILENIFKGKAELALKGDVGAVKRLAKEKIDEEIEARRLVMEIMADGSFRTLREKSDFSLEDKEKEKDDKTDKAEKEKTVVSHKVPSGG